MKSSSSPIHPGEFLLMEFILPLQLQTKELAHDAGMTQSALTSVLRYDRVPTKDEVRGLAAALEISEKLLQSVVKRYQRE